MLISKGVDPNAVAVLRAADETQRVGAFLEVFTRSRPVTQSMSSKAVEKNVLRMIEYRPSRSAITVSDENTGFVAIDRLGNSSRTNSRSSFHTSSRPAF